MELGETLGEAAIRETWEEAHARVELGALFAVVDVVHARQVHVFFRGSMIDAAFGAGAETLESRLVPPGELPWTDIAFPSVAIALRQYLADGAGAGPVHLATAPRFRLS
jgi:ADP-ribose pyrophosphatase YjhB (NUDIX family)